ncbi:hypothetical protein [Novosphingobium rosa]|uniref:hypothetical protein n=1 Tax=Novosphingobium rosa TaxID=76978 RepID=UPI00082B81D3|nr:hypothetical protein [Novosphingobium rosa]
MIISTRARGAALAAVTLLCAAPLAAALPTVVRADNPVQAAVGLVAPIVSRTHTTQATYAVYYWNRLTPQRGEASEEWSAEFNRGNWHRVETPRDRMIADCKAMRGIDLSLETGQIVSGPAVAKAACGINANRPVRQSEYLGRIDGHLGAFDRVRLTDASDIRTYDVSGDGVILGVTYANVDQPGSVTLTMTSTGLDHALPDSDMFSPESLGRSVVPDRFKAAPQGK